MNLLAALFLVPILGTATMTEADTPGKAVRDLAIQVLGSDSLLPSIPESVYSGLPTPGKGITFAARPFSSSTAGDVFPVELSARRQGRVLARRHIVFPFARGGLVVVARKVIEPGEVISQVDLALVPGRQERGVQKTFSRIADIAGQVAKTRIAAGRPITSRAVRSVHAVKRGQAVTVVRYENMIKIAMKGRAIQDGSLGEMIRVLNIRSNKMIDGRVMGSGLVEIQSISQGRM
jgi:flagella basal body P-ring formation protein FlgA